MPFHDSDCFRKDNQAHGSDARWTRARRLYSWEGQLPRGQRQLCLPFTPYSRIPASSFELLGAPDIAGFVLANAMSTNQSGEGTTRQAFLEADLVDCMVALPGQLFYSTQIPVCLWFLATSKAARVIKLYVNPPPLAARTSIFGGLSFARLKFLRWP